MHMNTPPAKTPLFGLLRKESRAAAPRTPPQERSASRPAPARGRRLVAGLSALLAILPAASWADKGDTCFWKNGVANGNWNNDYWYNTTRSWDNHNPGYVGYQDLRFDNTSNLAMTNNWTGAGTNQWRITFVSGTGSRTIYGTTQNTFSNSGSKVENNDDELQTVGFPIRLAGSTELNPVNGDLTISGNVDNNAQEILVWGSNSKMLTLSGVVSGTGPLRIKANSKVKISGASTYTGITGIEAGEFWFATGGLIGSSSTIILGTNSASGTTAKLWLESSGIIRTNAITVDGGNAGMRIIGGLNTSGSVTYRSTITLNGPVNFEAASGGSVVLNGPISGTERAVNKTGAGEVWLMGTNTYTGTNYVQSGTLILTHSNALGAYPASARVNVDIYPTGMLGLTNNAGVTLAANRTIELGTVAGPRIWVAASRTGTVNGVIQGSAAWTNFGPGTLVLAGNNTFSGGLTVLSNSVLRLAHANALGTTAGATTISSGSALELTNGLSYAAEPLTVSGTGVSSGGAIRNRGGANSLSGLVTLGAASSIRSDSGTLTLDVASGSAITGTYNLTLGGAGHVTVNDPIAIGTGTLTKDGATGILTLAGVNTYSGATTVSAGTNIVSGSASSSAFTVASGATLMGAGTVGGLTLNGRADPGNSAAARATLNCGAVSLNNGGSLQVDMSAAGGAAGTGWDLLNSSGVITPPASGTFTIYLNDESLTGFTSSTDYSWKIVAGTSVGAFNASYFTVNTTQFGTSFNGTFSVTNVGGAGIGLYLVYTANVLDPASFTAAAANITNNTLTFSANAGGNNVVIVYNLTGTFGTPSGAPPAVGGSLASGTLVYNGTSSPQTHTGLVSCTRYYYKAFSYYNGRYSAGLARDATTATPAAPTGVLASNTNSTDFTASWSAALGASNYRVDVSTNATFGSGLQNIISAETVGTAGSSGDSIATHESNNRFVNTALTMSGSGDVRNTSASSGYTGASGVNNVMLNAASENFIIEGINTTGYANMKVYFGIRKNTNGEDGSTMALEASTNGTTWVSCGSISLPTGENGWYYRTNSIPNSMVGANMRLRYTTSSTTEFRLDDILVTGDAVDFVSGYQDRQTNTTSCLVTGLTANVTYYFRVRSEGAGGCASVNSSTGTVTTTAGLPFVALADNGSPVAGGNVAAASVNNVLHKFQLVTTNAGATLTNVSFTSAGTYAAADLANFKVWHSVNNTFESGTDTSLGTISASLGPGARTFTGLSQSLALNSTNYFFITADLSATAEATNTISVNAMGTGDFMLSQGTKTGSTSAGGVQTNTAALTINNTGAPVAGNIGAGANNVVLSGFQLVITGRVSFTTLNLATAGTATSSDLNSFRVALDVNNNGTYEAGTDTIVSSTNALANPIAFTMYGQTSLTGTPRYLVIANVAASPTAGNHFTGSIAAASDVTTTGTESGTAAGSQQTITVGVTIDSLGCPVAGTINANSTNVVFGFRLQPSGTVNFNAVTITKTGTTDTSDLSQLRIVYDADSDGVWDVGETVVSSTNALSGSMAFTMYGQTGLGAARRYLLVANVSHSAVAGRTFTGSIAAAGDVDTSGAESGTASGTLQTVQALVALTYEGPIAQNRFPPENNAVIFGFQMYPTGTVSFTQFTLTVSGSATAGDWTNFRVALDANKDWAYGGGDSIVSSTQSIGSTIVFTIYGQTAVNTTNRYLVIADSPTLSTAGSTFTGSIPTPSHVDTTGVESGTVTGTAQTNTTTVTIEYTGSPAATNIAQGANDVVLSGFRLSRNTCTVPFTQVKLTTGGTATSSDLSQFRIVLDADNSGTYNGGDSIAASTNAHGATMTFTMYGQSLTANTRYLVIANVAGGATAGRTITTSITGAVDVVSGGVENFVSGAGNTMTIVALPTVTSPTVNAGTIDTTTATLGANVTSLGGEPSLVARGTVWGTAANPTGNAAAEGGTGTGAFTHGRSGFSAGTLYYYRGYAQNSVGTAYSADGTFYTEPNQVSGITFANVTTTGMRISWTAGGASDGAIVVMRAASSAVDDPADGTEHGASATYGSTALGSSYVVYRSTGTQVDVTGLSAGTTYYVEIFAYKGSGAGSTSNSGINYQQDAPLASSRATLAAEPTTHSSSINFTSVGSDQMTVNWTSGNGGNRIVVVKQGSAVNWDPTDGTAPATVNTNFSLAGDQGSGNKICYNGSGSSFTLVGLSASTTYHVEIFEYSGSGTEVNYYTGGTPPTGSQATTAAVCTPDKVTITQSTNQYDVVWSNGTSANFFDDSGQIGMWANGDTAFLSAWKSFRDSSGTGGALRKLQIGDEFTVCLNTHGVYYGQLGVSLNRGGSTGSWANRTNGFQALVQQDGGNFSGTYQIGSWYAKDNGTESFTNTPAGSSAADYTIKFRITASDTYTVDLNGTTKYDRNFMGSPGTNDRIDAFSVYLTDDRRYQWDWGDNRRNSYIKQVTAITNLGYVEFGGNNNSPTVSGLITDGNNPKCTNTASPNFLKKIGTGTLTLTATNTYSLYTEIANGTLNVPRDSVLGTAPVSPLAHHIRLTGAGAALVGTETFTLNANRGLSLSNWAYLAVASAKTVTYNGVIADGAGSQYFVKNQAGELVLGGNSTFDGGSYLDEGTLTMTHAGGLGGGAIRVGRDTSTQSAVLNLGAAITVTNSVEIRTGSTGVKTLRASETATASGPVSITETGDDRVDFDVASGKTLTLSGVISGSGTGEITKKGAGTLLMSNANNTHSNKITLDAGVVSIAASRHLGADLAANLANKLVFNGGTLKATASFSLSQYYSTTLGAGNGFIDVDTGQTLTVPAAISGSGSFGKLGNGTLVLSGAGTSTGPLTNSAGLLQIGAGGTAGSLSANLVNNAALAFNRSDASTYSGIISGAGALTNVAGTLTLSGHSTLSGGTVVSGGRLIVSGSLSNSAVTVASGATLAGSGKVGNLTVTGTVDPTNAAAATLPCGTLTLNAGGGMRVDLSAATGTAGTAWDLVSASGAITANGSGTFTITVYGNPTGFSSEAGYSWKIMGGASVSSFDSSRFAVATNGTFGTAGDGGTFSVTNTGTDGTGIYLVFRPRTPVDPTAFTVTAVGIDSNSISFTRNAQNDDLVIVFDTDNTFTTPTGTAPAAGGAFAGGTVVYKGGASPAVHSGLNCGTLYYYKAWSMKGTNYSAPGVTGNATTLTISPPASIWASATNENDFTASWSAVAGAASYRLDVSTVNNFASFVSGYNNLTVAGTSQSVTGLAFNTPYYFRVRTVGTGCSSVNSSTATVTTAIGTAYVALSDNGTQIAAGNVLQGTVNHVLHRFKLAVTNNSGTLTNVSFSTAGSYVAADITNLIVWYSADATWDGADTRLFTNTTGLGPGWHGHTDALSQVFNNNSTGYVFITADIAPAATPGATLQVSPAVATTNVLFAKATKTGSTTAGGLQTVIGSEPTTHASNLSFSAVQGQQMTLNWTSGNGGRRIVVVRSGAAVSWTPTDLVGPTGVNTNFGGATDQGSGNRICYDGTANTFTLTGLTPDTTYHVKIFEYNGTGAYVNYYTGGSPLTGSQLTACVAAPATLWASATNDVNFTAVWDAAVGATGYRLDVSAYSNFMSSGSLYLIDEDFVSFADWTDVGTGNDTDSGHYGAGSPCRALGSGDSLTSPAVDYPTQLVFYVDASSGGNGSKTTNYYSTNGTTWLAISTITVSTAGATITNNLTTSPDLSGQTNVQFRFVANFNTWYLDDVQVTGGNQTPSYVNAYSNRAVAGTSQAVTGLTSGVQYWYRVRAEGASGCTSLNSSTATVTTIATPAVTLANNGTQVAAANVQAATAAHVLHKFQLSVATAGTTLTNLSFTSAGGYVAADLANFKLWHSTDNALSTGTDTCLGTNTAALGPGLQSFGFSQSLAINTTNYFFITADIATSPTYGNTVRVEALATTNVFLSAGNKSGSTTASGNQTLIARQPTTHASGVNFTAIGMNQMTVNWTSGNGERRIVVVRQGAAVGFTPVDGTAPTGVNANFGSATDQGSGNKICYDGTGASFTLTGLNPGTLYYVKIFEYNGTGTYVDYYTGGTPANGSESTICSAAPTGLIASHTNYTAFTSAWNAVSGATDYRLDVSTNATFTGSAGGANTNAYHSGNALGGGTGGLWTEEDVAQGSGYIIMTNATSLVATPAMNFTLGTAQTLNFRARTYGGPSSAQATITVSVSTNNGSTWASLGTREPTTTSLTAMSPFDLSSYVHAQVKVKIETLGAGANKGVGVDDILVTNLMAASSAYVGIYSNLAVAGTSQVVTGLTEGTLYYFRVRSEASPYCTSANSSTQSVITRIDYAPEPTVQAHTLTFANHTATTLDVNWTNGNGTNRIVIAKQGSAVDSHPVDGTPYAANGEFASGQQLGTGNYVVFKGTNGGPITVSGLSPNTTYHFRVYEYNGSGYGINYLTNTASGNPASQATYDLAPGIGNLPAALTATTTVGSNPSSGAFTVTNVGGAALSYSVQTNAAWLSVSPATGSGLTNLQTVAHTVSYNVNGMTAGVYTATLTVTNTGTGQNVASNSPKTISVILTNTAIANPTSVTATNDGKTLVRLGWLTNATHNTVLLVYKSGSAPTAPTPGTTYTNGGACGGGTVIYKGTGTNLEHVVGSNAGHYYALYSINNNHYSAGVATSVTTTAFASFEIVETFSYTNATTIAGKNGEQGWGGGWYGDTGVFTNSLGSFGIQTNYPTPTGNKLWVRPANDANVAVYRPLAQEYKSGRLYFGYILNYEYNGGSKYEGLSLMWSNTNEKLFIGEIGSQDQQLGIDSTGSSYTLTAGSGNDYVIVGYYDWAAGEAKAKAYKIGTQAVPADEPTSWDVTVSKSSNTVGWVNTIRLAAGEYDGGSSGTPGNTYFDEVRLATNWNDLLVIVPSKPAAPASASATRDGNEMNRLAWTTNAAGNGVMILRGTAAISTEPTDGSSYAVGASIGAATVIYRGGATALEHVVAAGTTNHYKFYSYTSANYYSTGVVVTAIANDAYLSYEHVNPFSYTNGTSFGTTLTGGQGFGANYWVANSGTWRARTNVASATASEPKFVNLSGYPDMAGNLGWVENPGDGGSATADRDISPSITTGSFYVAFMMAYQYYGSNKWAGLSLMNGGTEKAFFGKGSGANWSTLAAAGGGSTYWSAFDLMPTDGGGGSTGNVYLVVGKYDFATKELKTKAWNLLSGTFPGDEPTSWDATGTLGTGIDQINRIRLNVGANNGSIGRAYFDEIRYATNWAGLIAVSCPTWAGSNFYKNAAWTAPGTAWLGDSESFMFQSFPVGLGQSAGIEFDWAQNGTFSSYRDLAWLKSANNNSYWSNKVQLTTAGAVTSRYVASGPSCSPVRTNNPTLTVSNLNPPTVVSATRDSVNTNSAIDLAWTRGVSGVARDTLIIRQTVDSGWSAPVNGTTYNAGDSVGSATVVYRGASTTGFEDGGLAPSTTYYYRFYAENWTYYSTNYASASAATAAGGQTLVVDGNFADWLGTPPAAHNSSASSRQEYIWTDKRGEVRPEQPLSGDVREFRVYADDTWVYFLVRMSNIADQTKAFVSIGVDTRTNSASTSMNWLGDDAGLFVGGEYFGDQAAIRYPEYQLNAHWVNAESAMRVEMFTTSADYWAAPPSGNTNVAISTVYDAIEMKIARADLNLTGAKTARFTVASFVNGGAWNNDGDGTLQILAGTADAIDALSIAPYNEEDNAANLSAWQEDLRDSDVDFWFDVKFGASGLTDNQRPSTPVLVSPTNNQGGVANPTLRWQKSTDADGQITGYLLEVSTNEQFSGVSGTENGSVLLRVNLNAATTNYSLSTTETQYWWRVRARDTAGELSATTTHVYRVTGKSDIEGPQPTLVYIGTNVTGFLAGDYNTHISRYGYITNVTDREIRNTNNVFGFVIRWDDPSGVYATNKMKAADSPPNGAGGFAFNIVTNDGRVSPNWDIHEYTNGVFKYDWGKDQAFHATNTRANGNNGLIVTNFLHSAFTMTNYDPAVAYYLTLSAEDSCDEGGSWASYGSWNSFVSSSAALPYYSGWCEDGPNSARNVTVNHLIRINVTDDDATPPTAATNKGWSSNRSLHLSSGSSNFTFSGSGQGVNYTLYDGEIFNQPFLMQFNVWDPYYRGLAWGTAATQTDQGRTLTNTSLTVENWLTNNVDKLSAGLSSVLENGANPTSVLAWSWSPLGRDDVTALWGNADLAGEFGLTNAVALSLFDLDNDRQGDQSSADVNMGWITVRDDDATDPQIVSLTVDGVGGDGSSNLFAGGVAIIGINGAPSSNPTVNPFQIVVLQPYPVGTRIHFSDCGWSNNAAIGWHRTNEFNRTYWDATSAGSVGDVITLVVSNLNTGGDQLAIYQYRGTLEPIVDPTNCVFISAVNCGSGWSSPPVPDNNQSSALYRGLTNAVNAVALTNATSVNAYYVGPRSGTASYLMQQINQSTNWVHHNVNTNYTFNTNRFTVTGAGTFDWQIPDISDHQMRWGGYWVTSAVYDAQSGVLASNTSYGHGPYYVLFNTNNQVAVSNAFPTAHTNGATYVTNVVQAGTGVYETISLGVVTMQVAVADADNDRANDTRFSTNTQSVSVYDDDTIPPTVALTNIVGTGSRDYVTNNGEIAFYNFGTSAAETNLQPARYAAAISVDDLTARGGAPNMVNGASGQGIAAQKDWGADATNYWEWTVSVMPGFLLDLQKFQFDYRSTGSGPQNYVLQVVVGTVTNTLASGALTRDSTWRTNSLSGLPTAEVDGIVKYRLYGTDSGTGSFSIDNVSFTGKISVASGTYLVTDSDLRTNGVSFWASVQDTTSGVFGVSHPTYPPTWDLISPANVASNGRTFGVGPTNGGARTAATNMVATNGFNYSDIVLGIYTTRVTVYDYDDDRVNDILTTTATTAFSVVDDDAFAPKFSVSGTYLKFDGPDGGTSSEVTDGMLTNGLTISNRLYDARSGVLESSVQFRIQDPEGWNSGLQDFTTRPGNGGARTNTWTDNTTTVFRADYDVQLNGRALGVWTSTFYAVDYDNDRPNDALSITQSFALTVIDDDKLGPRMTNLQATGAAAGVLLVNGFEEVDGWTNTFGGGSNWTYTATDGRVWQGNYATVMSTDARGTDQTDTGFRSGFNTTNSLASASSWLQLPPLDRPGWVTVWAKLSAAGESKWVLERLDGAVWNAVSNGEQSVTTTNYAEFAWLVDSTNTGVSLRLRLTERTQNNRAIYYDDLIVTPYRDWTNQPITVTWSQASDLATGNSGIGEYRQMPLGTNAPLFSTNGTSLGSATSVTYTATKEVQGTVTGYVFAVDNDQDRGARDRAMGVAIPNIARLDITPPTQVPLIDNEPVSTEDVDDPTSQFDVTWKAGDVGGDDPGRTDVYPSWGPNRQFLSPWKTYKIYYGPYDSTLVPGGDPGRGFGNAYIYTNYIANNNYKTNADWKFVVATNRIEDPSAPSATAYTNLANGSTNKMRLYDLEFDTEYVVVVVGVDKAGNEGPATPASWATNDTIKFALIRGVTMDKQEVPASMTNKLSNTNVETASALYWIAAGTTSNQIDYTSVKKDYDLLYWDAASFRENTNNAWKLIDTVRTNWFVDDGGQSRARGAVRFYRASYKDRWMTSRTNGTNVISQRPLASEEVYSLHNVVLSGGPNFVALQGVPYTNTFEAVFGGTENFPGGPSGLPGSGATLVEFYNGGTNAEAVATNIYWLRNDGQWLQNNGPVVTSNLYPQNFFTRGFSITLPDPVPTNYATTWAKNIHVLSNGLPSTVPAMVWSPIMQVPTNNAQNAEFSQVIKCGVSTGRVATTVWNVCALRIPVGAHPSQMRLIESGFVNGTREKSDQIFTIDTSTKGVLGTGSTIYCDESETWRFAQGNGLVPWGYFRPNDVVVIVSRNGGLGNTWTWRYSPVHFYTNPNRWMGY